MQQAIRKAVLRADHILDKSRGWHYIVLLVGVTAFVATQNFRVVNCGARGWINELAVMGVFIGGLLVSKFLARPYKLSVIFWLYLFGLAFEILTESKWDYKYIMFVIREDISLTFPFGWTGLCIAATAVSEHVYKWSKSTKTVNVRDNLLIRLDIVVWILMGGCTETIFYRLGMIHRYLDTYPMGMSFFGPPWWIILWYGLFPGFILSLLIRNLEYDAYEPKL